MKKNVIVASGIAASLALFAACGDEVTEVTKNDSFGQAKNFAELPECEEEIEGSLVYVTDSAKTFVCTGNGWTQMNGNDGEIVSTIKSAEKGNKGKDGTSCTAKANEDKTSFDVICDGKTVGTVKSGGNGEKGDACTLTEIENGQVVVKCGEESATLFKASCGVGSYDPATQFCANDMKVYPLCHNTLAGLEPYLNPDGTYNVNGYFCDASDLLVPLCNAQPYDFTTQFCAGYKYGAVPRCSKEPAGLGHLSEDGVYSRDLYFCDANDSLVTLCGGSTYDTKLQFCNLSGTEPHVAALCAGQTYEIETHMCINGQVEEAIACCIPKGQNNKWCDGHPNSLYDVRKQFCDTRDGHPYKFKTITKTNENGEVVYSETWMTENLKYTKTQEGEYVVRSDDDKCSTYGCYYTWAAANNYCPEGWDLPVNADYRALMDAFGSKPTVYRLNGTNISGFSVIDVGGYYLGTTGESSDSTINNSYFWSKTERTTENEEEPTTANRFFVGAKNTVHYTGYSEKIDYLSVRCIKKSVE